MSDSPKQIAMRILDALQAKDLVAALDLMADDVVLIDPHYPNPTMTGKAEITEGMDFAFGFLKVMSWTVLHAWEDADSAVLECDTHHVAVNGMEITPRQVFVANFKDGKIVRWRSYVPYPPPAPPA